MHFQNGKVVRVVGLGFPEARGGACERFSNPEIITSNASQSLSLCSSGASSWQALYRIEHLGSPSAEPPEHPAVLGENSS
jgi:hypothetical protein